MSFDECVKFLTFELVDTLKVPVLVGTVNWSRPFSARALIIFNR